MELPMRRQPLNCLMWRSGINQKVSAFMECANNNQIKIMFITGTLREAIPHLSSTESTVCIAECLEPSASMNNLRETFTPARLR